MTATITNPDHYFRAEDVAITPDGRHAYIAGTSGVSVVDTASNTVTATITIPRGSNRDVSIPQGVAVTPDGQRAYITTSVSFIEPGAGGQDVSLNGSVIAISAR